ncbi:MAG TPA: dienelactone hydrolase family protein [Gemmatimonadales bacterium]|nr:dienelactone hydrolase family protein [Gemmatimonadales bacterium]
MRLFFAAALASVCLASTHVPRDPWWGATLERGIWDVGFEAVLLADTSRHLGIRPRPLQLALWYPAVTSPGVPLTYSDYLRLAAAETTSVDTARLGLQAIDERCAFLAAHAIPESTITRWFTAPMLAKRDIPPARGPFPLVLIAQGNGESAVDQSVLAEYLASWGYVVATSPSQARITGEPESESDVGTAAQDQARDLAALRGALAQRGEIDPARLGIVGHSFGARSALLYAMRDPHVLAVVSLDGGIGTATARAFYESAPGFDPRNARAPVLHVYEQLDPEMSPDWTTLRKLDKAPVWLARTHALRHHHFTALGAAAGAFPALAIPIGATRQTALEYAGVLAMTRAFLDTYLREANAFGAGREWNGLAATRLPAH